MGRKPKPGFEGLWGECEPKLRAIACRELGIEAPRLVDDVIADTRIDALKGYKKFDPKKGTFKAWATAILKNKCKAAWRTIQEEQAHIPIRMDGENDEQRGGIDERELVDMKFIPEFQRKTTIPDEVLHQVNKETQIILDSQSPGWKLEFFDDRDRPEDNKFSISVYENEPGFLQVVYSSRGNMGLTKPIEWKTVREPKIVTKLKKTIKNFQKGGDNKQMAEIFNQISDVFKRLEKAQLEKADK